jgi:hypothetical protein
MLPRSPCALNWGRALNKNHRVSSSADIERPMTAPSTGPFFLAALFSGNIDGSRGSPFSSRSLPVQKSRAFFLSSRSGMPKIFSAVSLAAVMRPSASCTVMPTRALLNSPLYVSMASWRWSPVSSWPCFFMVACLSWLALQDAPIVC